MAKALGSENPHTLQAARNIAVVFQEEIEKGEYKKKIYSNTIGIVVISSASTRDDGESH